MGLQKYNNESALNSTMLNKKAKKLNTSQLVAYTLKEHNLLSIEIFHLLSLFKFAVTHLTIDEAYSYKIDEILQQEGHCKV